MHTLNAEQIHGKLLDILKEIDSFCRSHGIRYSLAGGTLLGAVRHKGFIPWDDDADVLMPRPDYDRFVALYNKECAGSKYRLLTQTMEKEHWYVNCYSKMENTRTVSLEYGVRNVTRFGINVDIFPVDGAPDNPEEQLELINSITSLKRRIVIRQRPWLRLLKKHPGPPLVYFLSRRRSLRGWVELTDKTIRSYPFETSNYAGALCGLYAMKEVFPRRMFEEYAEYPFEDTVLMGLKDADGYLTSLYGDWRQLPPEQERNGKHELKAWEKDSDK